MTPHASFCDLIAFHFFPSHHISIVFILSGLFYFMFNFSLVVLYLFIYLFYFITTVSSFLSSQFLPPPLFSVPSIHFSNSIQKRVGLPWISTEHGIYMYIFKPSLCYTDSFRLSCPYNVANIWEDRFRRKIRKEKKGKKIDYQRNAWVHPHLLHHS